VCAAWKGMLTQSLIAGFICCTFFPAAILCFSQLFFTFSNSSASIHVTQRRMWWQSVAHFIRWTIIIIIIITTTTIISFSLGICESSSSCLVYQKRFFIQYLILGKRNCLPASCASGSVVLCRDVDAFEQRTVSQPYFIMTLSYLIKR
jgi:hypothetical protein